MNQMMGPGQNNGQMGMNMASNRPSNANILQSQDMNSMNMQGNSMAGMNPNMGGNMFNKKSEGNIGFDNSTITQKIDDMFTKEEDDLDQFYKNYSKSPIRGGIQNNQMNTPNMNNMNRFNNNMMMDNSPMMPRQSIESTNFQRQSHP